MCYQSRHTNYFLRLISALLISFLIFQGPAVFSQLPHASWRNYNTDHGLPTSSVYCILQDREGYLWFGTGNGLSRFDGYTFQNYGPADGLKNNMVIQLQEDEEGRIWIATLSQNLYYYHKDSIYAYTHNTIIQDQIHRFDKYRMLGGYFYREANGTLYLEMPGLGILKIRSDSTYQLFQSQTPRGLIVMDLGQQILSSYTDIPIEEQNALRQQGIYPAMELYQDSIPTIIRGFQHRIKPSNNLVKRIDSGQYLVGRSNAHYLIDGDTIIWSGEHKISESSTPKSFLIDQEGALLTASFSGGEFRKYKDLDAFKNQSFRLLRQTPFITSLLIDREKGLWMGTSGGGVYYQPNDRLAIYDRTTGLPFDPIHALTLVNEDSIIIGSNLQGIYLIDRKSSSIQPFPDIEKGWNRAVLDLIYDPKRNSVIASSGRVGIFRRGKWSKIPITYPSGRQGFLSGKRISLNADHSVLWLSLMNRIERKNLDALSDSDVVDFYPFPERSFVVYEDQQQRVWMGAMSGLYQLRKDTFLRPEFMPSEFSLRVEDIDELSDSTLVIGTKGAGILLWKADRFLSVDATKGLTANMIEAIHVDNQDNIWVGTREGLNKVERRGVDSFFVKRFTIDHGMPSNEINRITTWKDNIWVATNKGLVHFQDDQVFNSKSDPPKLEKILVNNLSIDIAARSQFSSSENNLVIHYLSIDYDQNGKIPYRYRLTPTETTWNYTFLRSVNFSALKAGVYTFEVQRQNEDGIWSPSTLYTFQVHPPFWQTWWFISLMSLLVVGAAYRFYTIRTRQLRQEAEMVKQIAELERAAMRAQMNPHFIFNCLSSISSFFNQGDKVSGNHYLSVFAQLIRSVLHHSMTRQISLEEELQLLENYLKMEQMRFEDSFDYSIQLGEKVEPFEIEIPPMLLQPYIENAIIHGLAKKEGKGKIDLQCDLENGYLKIMITDNGIGITQSKKQKAATTSLHKSVGMTITQKRLSLLAANGREGKVTVEELENTRGAIRGTSVKVWIPLP